MTEQRPSQIKSIKISLHETTSSLQLISQELQKFNSLKDKQIHTDQNTAKQVKTESIQDIPSSRVQFKKPNTSATKNVRNSRALFTQAPTPPIGKTAPKSRFTIGGASSSKYTSEMTSNFAFQPQLKVPFIRSNSNKESHRSPMPRLPVENKSPFGLYEKQLKNDSKNMPVEWEEDCPVAKSTMDLRQSCMMEIPQRKSVISNQRQPQLKNSMGYPKAQIFTKRQQLPTHQTQDIEVASEQSSENSARYNKNRQTIFQSKDRSNRVSSPLTSLAIRAGFETHLTSLLDNIYNLLNLSLTAQTGNRKLTEHEQLVRIRQGLQRMEKQIVQPLVRTQEYQEYKKQAEAKRIGRLINGEERSTSASRIADEYLISNLCSANSGKGSFAMTSSVEGKFPGRQQKQVAPVVEFQLDASKLQRSPGSPMQMETFSSKPGSPILRKRQLNDQALLYQQMEQQLIVLKGENDQLTSLIENLEIKLMTEQETHQQLQTRYASMSERYCYLLESQPFKDKCVLRLEKTINRLDKYKNLLQSVRRDSSSLDSKEVLRKLVQRVSLGVVNTHQHNQLGLQRSVSCLTEQPMISNGSAERHHFTQKGDQNTLILDSNDKQLVEYLCHKDPEEHSSDESDREIKELMQKQPKRKV
ncbi:hypothetical protein FGO68_gene4489 [Halteria grandinella]|uniref:Uncharacterized protein n=1 Tax=Halteria grandinella TaxID=5974 RepID=A0A8J8NTT0_HALGN|nr:hypothetical protein FGO68_gene4489 [Halteria grandinella]